MIDWLIVWGMTKGVEVLVYPILQDLAKEGAKDFAKDFFKDSLKHVFLREKDPRQIAAGKAIKEFLQLVQQQLKFRCKLTDNEIKKYVQEVRKFITDKSVKEILGKGFDADCESLDAAHLKEIWQSLQLKSLPNNFDWEGVTKQYLLKVQEILWDSEDLRVLLDSQNLKSIEKNTQEIAGIIPEFDLAGYQIGIQERYGNLKLDSLDTTGSAYNELKLWRIFIAQNVREIRELLPQIYEIPKEYQIRLQENNQLEQQVNLEDIERHKQLYFQEPICPVLDIINEKQNYKYIVILGDPGSGKSTLLQYLALNWAESPLSIAISQPIPLLIELRTYLRRRENSECYNFLEFFHKCSGAIYHLNQHQLHEQLKSGNALVMFDGLDEVFDIGIREDVITDIHRFTNEYPHVRVIVTSRVIGYKAQRLRDAEFRHFMLQDLETEQIQDFINRWHDLTFNDEIDKLKKRERLQKAINTSKSIQELAGNPLLLTMMAILNRHQELPRDRPELYNQASRVLLHQWDVERALVEDARVDPKTIDYKDKQAMLRQVAYQMQANDKSLAGNLISASDLEKVLINYLKILEFDSPREIARVMINQLRTRNFILCFVGADYYAFVHRTFLEYFCAWEFVWRFKETQTLSIEQLKIEVFGKHWQDESWHEVLRLIAGMLEPRFIGEIIDYLLEQDGEAEKFTNIFLAAELFQEVRNQQLIMSTANKLRDHLNKLSKYDLMYYYEDYDEIKLVKQIRTSAFAKIVALWPDDPNTLSWFQHCATIDENSRVVDAAIEALSSNFKEHINTLFILKDLATEKNSVYVQRAAIEALASNFKEHPDIFDFIKNIAINNVNSPVRHGAVRALGVHFKEHPDTVPFIKQRGINDDNFLVRRAAGNVLAYESKEHPDTLPFLKQLIMFDKDKNVKFNAALFLASNFKEHSDTFDFLKQCATANDGNLRYAGVSALGDNFKEHPDILPFLKQCANSHDKDVRIAALQSLTWNSKDDPNTLTILKQCTTDDDENIRYYALFKLGNDFKQHPDTLSILKQNAIANNSQYACYAAVRSLTFNFKKHPDIFNTFQNLAITSSDSSVRYQAVMALARYFQTNPELFELFYNCAKNDPFEQNEEEKDNPRLVALKIITKQYPHHPQTLPLLHDRVENDIDKEVRQFAQQQLVRYICD